MMPPSDEAVVSYLKSEFWTAKHWSLIRHAGHPQTPEEGNQALSLLLKIFTPALRGQLMRWKHLRESEAEELVQDFLVHKIVAKKTLEKIKNESGKSFRGFLYKSLWNHCTTKFRGRAREEERARGYCAGRPEEDPEEAIFAPDTGWMECAVAEAVERFQGYCQRNRQEQKWRIVRDYYLEPIRRNQRPPTNQELADRYGCTLGQVANSLREGRKHFRQAVRSVSGNYSRSKADSEEEVKYFCELSKRTPGRLAEILARIWDDE